ncbi:hypothetical protein PGIGA_G00150170 [Pangasianodon gigas]|uniref:Uncharacterized protein n=1 Tax=Pangasianodon gigas TaxID=30993 RepID=A0ACC5XNS5_PANGG|nr:hypothetical protein [Pangasianodon gigas]
MFLGGEEKLENQEETHMDMERPKLRAEPGTLELLSSALDVLWELIWTSASGCRPPFAPAFPSRSRCHGDCNAGGATDALPWRHVTRSGNSSGCISELQFFPSQS